MMIHHNEFSGVHSFGNKICTQNFNPGHSVYGEELIEADDRHCEYRVWDPNRSKLAAWIRCGAKAFPFHSRSKVLYLGAASGTTVSHLSDICFQGTIFALEFSLKNFQKLMALSKMRSNIIPLAEDARFPSRYRSVVGKVDCIYQDISQRDQVEILDSNATCMIDGGRPIMLMLKARSMDVTSDPYRIFNIASRELVGKGYIIEEMVDLGPYQKDHMGYLLRRD